MGNILLYFLAKKIYGEHILLESHPRVGAYHQHNVGRIMYL